MTHYERTQRAIRRRRLAAAVVAWAIIISGGVLMVAGLWTFVIVILTMFG